MSFKKFRLTVYLSALCAIGLGGVAQAADWKFALEEGIDEVQGVYATKFKEYIEANSDHTITIFPFGTLGESADTIELTQAGAVQFVNASPGFTGAIIAESQVFMLPYKLPESEAALDEFFRNSELVRGGFEALFRAQGLKVIDFYPEGEMIMTTKVPVRSRNDLSGVKFRTMTSPILVEQYRAFGANPTPLPWGEVYSSLQLNLIQGQENPVWFVESTKIYEVVDYLIFAGHSNYTTSVAANAAFYDGLSDEDKTLIEAARAEAFDHIMEYRQKLEAESVERMKEAKPSLEVIRLSDEERSPFREAAASVEAAYLEIGGSQAEAILAQFKADVEAAKKAAGMQ